MPGGPTADEVADEFVERSATLDPVAATSLGIAGHDAELTDYSPGGVEARAELVRTTLGRLRRVTAGTERDVLAVAVMAERLQALADLHDAGEWRRELNVVGSPVQAVRRCFDLMATATADDWQAVASRLEQVPEALAGIRATLLDGATLGTPASRRQALAVAAQARTWSGGDGTVPFFSTLAHAHAHAPLGGDALTRRLDRAAAEATTAYAGLADFLVQEYAPRAAADDGVGRDRYGLAVRVHNGVELDLAETERWGWEELHRIEDEMVKVAGRILPGRPVPEAMHLLETDPGRAIEGAERFRAWLQELMDAAVAGLDGVHFDIPGPLRRVEAMLAPPGGAAAAYYTGPSEDLRRPGRTWYPTRGRTRFPRWAEVSVAYHEGVPGHHLQIGTTCALAGRLNRFQRTMAFTPGHGEGWALYAERLMDELGYLDDPEHRLGMLAGQALRAARVVVDIGLHLGLRIPAGEAPGAGERWTPGLARSVLATRALQPGEFVASEVDRYLGWPAQAVSYKVGERVWLEGREAARRRAGTGFDLKAFHARALELGPMGLGELSRRLPVVC